MTNGIYGYYDTKNQYVIYIGQDSYINKEKRHREHLRPSMYDRQHINRILQSNPNRYTYFKLVEGNYTQDEIDNFEKEAIKLFKTYKHDYPKRNVFNFTPGGDLSPMKVPEIAQKISESMSGENNPMYGKTGEKHHMYGVRGKEHPNYGKTFSQEHRDKISQALKGHQVSKETREKISLTRKGMKLSQEVKDDIAIQRNSSGYFRVFKHKDKTYKQGFCWRYVYTGDDGKRKTIQAPTLNKLEIKVRNKGLLWKKINNSD